MKAESPFKLPPVPNQAALQKQMKPLLDQSVPFEIKSEDHFVAAWALIERHDVALKRVHELFDPFVSAADKLHKMAVDLRKQFLTPLENSKKALLGRRMIYRQKQEAKALYDAAKARELLEKEQKKELLTEAKKAEKKGDTEIADLFRQQAETVKVPELPPAPAVPEQAGSVLRKRWLFEITDPDAVPRNLCDPTPSRIRKVVEALGDKHGIPGVRVWPDKSEHSRKVPA